MKKKYILSLLLVTSLYACTSPFISVPVTSNIEDKRSPLVKSFDCRKLATVPKSWDLDSILIQQGTNENGEPYYRCNMNGTKNGVNRQFFSVYYNVVLSSTKNIAKTDLIDPTLLNGEEFYPTFLEIGEATYSLCSQNMEQQTCGLVFRENNAVIFVRFWTDGGVSAPEIENIVNPLIKALSQRLENMQNP